MTIATGAIGPLKTGNNLADLSNPAAANQNLGQVHIQFNAYAGADPTGATYSDAAWTAIIAAVGTANACIDFGPGTYKFAGQLSQTLSASRLNSITVEGAGSGATSLYFPTTTGGLNFALHAPQNSFHVRGMTLVTGAAGVTIAIRATQSIALGNFSQPTIDDVICCSDYVWNGTGSASNYWAIGIYTSGVSNVSKNNVTIYGTGTLGIGVKFEGAGGGYAIVNNLTKFKMFGGAAGYIYGTSAQGVKIAQSDFTNGVNGIIVNTGGDGLDVTQCQFDTTSDHVVFSGEMASTHFSDNLHYLYDGHSGFVIEGGNSYAIHHSTFYQHPGQTGASYGVSVLGNDAGNQSVIDGCVFNGLSNGVVLAAGTSGWTVTPSNQFPGVTLPIADSGSGNVDGGLVARGLITAEASVNVTGSLSVTGNINALGSQNLLALEGSSTGVAVALVAAGNDAAVPISILPQGSAQIGLLGPVTATGLITAEEGVAVSGPSTFATIAVTSGLTVSSGITSLDGGLNVAGGNLNVLGSANILAIEGSATGLPVAVVAAGTDASIPIDIAPKGGAQVGLLGPVTATGLLTAQAGLTVTSAPLTVDDGLTVSGGSVTLIPAVVMSGGLTVASGLTALDGGLNVAGGNVNVYGADNNIGIEGNVSGQPVVVQAFGSDANIPINITPKGSAAVNIEGPIVAGGGATFINGLIGTVGTPSSSTASGTLGEILFDTEYIYTCIGTNLWRRVATSSF